MLFFDDKSEVLEMVLTPHGVDLLRQGKLDPKFFAFFDDDILYDGAHAASSEEQNDIEERILHETPRLKPQRSYRGVESNIHDMFDSRDSETISPFPSIGRLGFYATEDDVPLWKVNFLNGKASGSVSYVDEVPKVSMENLEYSIYKFLPEAEKNESQIFDEERFEFDDGSSVTVVGDYILLDIEESGIDFDNDNFEIEIFEVEVDPHGNDKLTPLQFFKNPVYVKNGLLIESPEEYDESVKQKDIALVDYYFDVLFDSDIPSDILCSHTALNNDKNNIYLRDDGITVIERAGNVCDVVSGNEIVNQYDVRKEGDLGDTC